GDAIVIEVADRAIDTGRDPRERGARASLRLGHIHARRPEHGLAPVLREHLAEELVASAAHREHRLHVLERAALDADVAGDDPHYLLVQLAAVHDPDGTEAEAFLAKIGRAHLHRARHRPAD